MNKPTNEAVVVERFLSLIAVNFLTSSYRQKEIPFKRYKLIIRNTDLETVSAFKDLQLVGYFFSSSLYTIVFLGGDGLF